ncbi:MAG: protoglobin family protein [Planctomycetales bacterium]
MKQIDEGRLESDLPFRFEYLADFMGFTSEDTDAIQAAAMYLGPLIPQLVEQSYEKLLGFDSTARHFLPPQSGFDGPAPGHLKDVTQNHPQIQFRKEHLVRYFQQILGRTCDSRFVSYLDMVGKIHTPKAGNSEIDVPLVQMNALMGFLSDTLVQVIASLPLESGEMLKTIRAFNKLLWIQNDFITRHYQERSLTEAAVST